MQNFVALTRRGVFIITGAFLLVLSTVSNAQAADRIMVVLDGSGSMWGQIDGKPKLEIARETLREVLQNVPESTELGLIAYGHREKGNCDDIELIVPPAAGTAGRIVAEVDGLSFLGKTPLTAAVIMAATELRYTEDRATVVLITDGIETCDADICEAGKSLELQGVDFTAHVVGFGLSTQEGQQVACLAENTGGQFFSANDADSLVVALTETITVAVPEQTATLEAPETATAGSDIEVIWTGPENKNDYIAIAEVGAEEGKYISYAYTRHGSPAKFTMPDAIDSFEIRYVVSETKHTIASSKIVLTEVEATLNAPETAAAGAEVKVAWTGPDNKNDYIAISEVGAEEGKYIDYDYTRRGSPVTITTPDVTGSFEIRYVVGQSKRTLASTEIVLTEVEATLEVPETAPAGAEVKVAWTGPDNKNDYIAITEVGAEKGKYIDYDYTRRGSPAKINAPEGTGEFEIRYVVAQSKRTLVAKKITVTPVEAALKVLNTPVPGGNIKVEWKGPGYSNDYITIVETGSPEGSFTKYVYTRKDSVVEFEVPRALGKFEVRYVLGKSRRTLASLEVELRVATASVSANSPVVAGSVVEVTWTGPENSEDYIEIVASGAAADATPVSAARTAQGSPLSLFAPESAGDYEVRYKMRDSGKVLATTALKVE